MCGRFTLHHSTPQIAERFGVQDVLFQVEERYNIAPTQPVAAILQRESRSLEGLKWGLVPSWAKDPGIGARMINARMETLSEKPSFKNALTRRRCLIPADGFYEWNAAENKRPYHIKMRDGSLFAFAGLWDEWHSKENPDSEPLRTCTIITTTPNELMATLHHRMAVMLRPEDEDLWLDPTVKDVPSLLDCLTPYPDGALEAYAISRRVNTPAFDAPECIAPATEDDAPAPRASKRKAATEAEQTISLF